MLNSLVIVGVVCWMTFFSTKNLLRDLNFVRLEYQGFQVARDLIHLQVDFSESAKRKDLKKREELRGTLGLIEQDLVALSGARVNKQMVLIREILDSNRLDAVVVSDFGLAIEAILFELGSDSNLILDPTNERYHLIAVYLDDLPRLVKNSNVEEDAETLERVSQAFRRAGVNDYQHLEYGYAPLIEFLDDRIGNLLLQNEIETRATIQFSWIFSFLSMIGLLLLNKWVISGMADTHREALQRLEQEKNRSVQAAKMATLGEMASGIAHEINNPLAIINSRLQLLREQFEREGEIDRAKVQTALERTEAMTLRIAKIIQGLKSFARQGENDPKVLVNFKNVLDDTLELCSARLKNRGIDFSVSGLLDIEFNGRGVQISQVLLNLINNAADAIQEADERWIKLMVTVENKQALISITDSGRGIPAEIVEKLMQPFFTTKELGKGTGLGLSISKGIIEDHGGSLSYDASNPNTSFVISIPVFEFRERQPQVVDAA